MQGFTKSKIKQMLKFSVFYLDRQKSFVPKKKWSVPCTMDSSFFSQEMSYCVLTLLVYMALIVSSLIIFKFYLHLQSFHFFFQHSNVYHHKILHQAYNRRSYELYRNKFYSRAWTLRPSKWWNSLSLKWSWNPKLHSLILSKKWIGLKENVVVSCELT